MSAADKKKIIPPTQGFDPGEVDSRSVVAFGLVIVAIIVAVFIGITVFWDKFLIGRYKEVVEAAPNTQMHDLTAREVKTLNNYSYVDKAKGQVRIPLDRAMELLLAEVQSGKIPYNTKDTVKPVDPLAAAAAPAAAGAATPAAAATTAEAKPAEPAGAAAAPAAKH